MEKNISDLRTDYKKNKLDESELNPNPLKQLDIWLNEAINAEVQEPTAMALATSTKDGKPSVRIVLLKDINDEGLTFFSNYDSRKGKELTENPFASVVILWRELERQVRVEGEVKKISEEESNVYFNSRPFLSRISAAVSPQSQPIPDREYLEKRVAKFKESVIEYNVPKPANWGGYRLVPTSIELWQGRENRLHDRLVYSKIENNWKITRLAP